MSRVSWCILFGLIVGGCDSASDDDIAKTPESVLGAQVKLISCGSPLDAWLLAGFAHQGDIASCMAKYPGCEGMLTCVGVTAQANPEPVCEGAGDRYKCRDDKTVADCTGKVLYGIFDCSVVDASCVEAETYNADCVTPKVTCDPDGRRFHCLDNRIVDCREGHAVVEVADGNCGLLGLKCVERPADPPDGDSAVCMGTGPSCTMETSRCEGTVAVICRSGGEQRVDCALYGPDGACEKPDPETPPRCVLGNECEERESVPSCEGNTLVFCNRGRYTRADCTGYGFSSCSGNRCVE